MLGTNVPTRQLDVNVAVALRLVRSGAVPRRFFAWLAEPTTNLAVPARWSHTQLTESLAAILNPVLEDASRQEQKQIESAPQWLGAISAFMAEQHSGTGGYCMRLLAASLLPLYRTLATGKLHEGFQATQARLAENLTLVGLCAELGTDFRELLETKLAVNGAPVAVLRDEVSLDVAAIGQTVLQAVRAYDATADQFACETLEGLLDGPSEPTTTIADWAEPDLLWRLAGELIAKKSEMVLPRPWVDVPVPWSKIADHWNRLEHTLTNVRDAQPTPPGAAESSTGRSTPIASSSSPSVNGSADADIAATLERIAQAVDQEVSARAPQPANSSRGGFVGSPQLDSIDDSNAETDIESNVTDKLQTNSETNSETNLEIAVEPSAPIPREAQVARPQCLPKVILAEIRSHNDPLFVNVIRRRLATCRTEERTLSLSHIVVMPDDELQQGEVSALRDNGLTLWQQKLVNWLADHPHVHDPYAFLTSTGELILCVLDLERNEMTTILRQGLVEVLTGKQLEEAGDLSLAKVNIPARFHAGIAATSSPGASMMAEQLIEPAIRCLTAAQRHGRASIKSIEVY